MKIKIKDKVTDVNYGVFLLACMVSVSKAEKLAKEVNKVCEEVLCAICGKATNDGAVCDPCYKKEWREVRLDEGRG